MKPIALTLKSQSGLTRVLTTPISILKPDDTAGVTVEAIWDTGATGSVITKAVATSMGLVQTGISQVSTANGVVLQNTYTVDVRLPNGVTIQKVVVTEVDALAGGCDGLIGMDIITLGDFSITNHNGVTCMSFRVPSCHEIDYVASPEYGLVKVSSGPKTNYTPPKKKRKK